METSGRAGAGPVRALGRMVAAWLLAGCGAAAGEMIVQTWSVDKDGSHPQTVEILETDDGLGVVRIDLSALPKGATIHRARLFVSREELTADAMETRNQIYRLKAPYRPGARPGTADKPLAIPGPWHHHFDAAEAVRASAGSRCDLLVKSLPGWVKASTRLEVAYEGRARTVPAQVSGLEVFHRAGQTFVTWREVQPLITAAEATWGQVRTALAEAKDPFTYRVYVHDRPIDAASLPNATLLADVGPLSCWNTNGRSPEYLIGQAMIQPDHIGELAERHMRGTTGQYQHIRSWSMDDPRMDRCPLRRLAVDERAGLQPPGTGLYVHSPTTPGKRYYAVVSCRKGTENTLQFSPANALAKPLAETVGPGEPVRQGKGLWGPFFDYRGQRDVYVQWCGPPLSVRPNMYFNWSVLLPPGCVDASGRLRKDVTTKAPVELYFHGRNFSYAKPRQKYLLESIQIAPHDYPASGWYGFNDAWGTLKSPLDGKVSNHTQRRIAAFLHWAGEAFPLDPERILCTGGDGAAMLALAYRRTFALVLVNQFENDVLETSNAAEYARIWGPRRADIKDDAGRAEWSWAMLDELVKARPADDLPLFVCRGYSWGPFVKGFARGLGRFYDSILSTRQPLVADWTWASGKLVRPDKYTGQWRGLDLTRTTPVPAFSNCSTDKNTEGDGQHNLFITWGAVSDEKDSFTVELNSGRDATFDLTARRLQNFKVSPGQRLRWEAQPAPTRTDTQPKTMSGELTVDDHARIILAGLKISARAKLTVKVTRSE